ncbi:MAG: glycosyltransferase family 39 protein [bacterium]
MKKHTLFFIFIFIFLWINLYKVISDVQPFYDWDESIYVQLGKEMIQARSLTPLWQGTVWLDKPPLVPFVYGLMTLIPIRNEISMRVLTVFLSVGALSLIYMFVTKHSRSVVVGLMTVIITTYLPSYMQRSQVVNVDVFLVIGWFGYALFYKHRWLGALFLLIGVLSKSLLGLYPLGMIFIYEYISFLLHKKKMKNEFYSYIQTLVAHLFIASLWFIWAYITYRQEFIQYHFLDNQFKRITSSIEQHFGQRTFYIDLLVEQMKYAVVPALISIAVLTFIFIKNKSKDAYFSLLFIPWFLFLNLTKTKIAWYLYPVFPQFVYLAVYGVCFIKKIWVQGVVACILLFIFFRFFGYSLTAPLITHYSQWESHIKIALDAKKNDCKDLVILVSENTRTSYATLLSMDLVIHTTTWWGDHPSMAYYADMPTHYYYSVDEFEKQILPGSPTRCFITEIADWNEQWRLRVLSKNEKFVLGVKE